MSEESNDDIKAQIRDILIAHVGKVNAITSEHIAQLVDVNPGPSMRNIRSLILETIIAFRLPIAASDRGSNMGYYVIETENEFKEYAKNLINRRNKIDDRLYRIKIYFEESLGHIITISPDMYDSEPDLDDDD